ncbi:calcium/calmodulin-dependent protein kinase type 1B [Colletotrichum tofieldiae]|uniref:Autophagy-related protein 1 n=1 Tax=Colletotrichum tofieldiae TaxID=708197 RepID=A0A166YJ30_9PEZI|nr:calcium/calmodulin-dependent protein kinase type 1B [Colletotrichum tofieldiae]
MEYIDHGDLQKHLNILVIQPAPNWFVQISDFGISRRLRPEQDTLGTIHKGTLGYMAPEMLGFMKERDCPYAVDIWSLGAVVFRMITTELYLTDFALLQNYVASKSEFPVKDLQVRKSTESLIELLRQLLAPSPRERPSASEVLAHEWLKAHAFVSSNNSSNTCGETLVPITSVRKWMAWKMMMAYRPRCGVRI